MSSNAVFYIEYRYPGEEKWRLLENEVPMTKELYECKKAEAERNGWSLRDIIVREEAGGETRYYTRTNSLNSQGYLRDTFATHGMCAERSELTGRGFPEDASEGFRSMDEGYMASAHDYLGEPRDFRYDKTWFTLSELESLVDILEERVTETLEKELRNVLKAVYHDEIKETKDKLDKLTGLLTRFIDGNAVAEDNTTTENDDADDTVGTEKEYVEDTEDAKRWLFEAMDERIAQYVQVSGLYNTVKNIMEEYFSSDWKHTPETRIIMYIH